MTGRPGGAVMIEIPAGHRDDPLGKAGLAALLAAVLGEPACGGLPVRAAAAGWRSRHRLDERASSFAFWSRRPDELRCVLDEARRTALPEGAAGDRLLDKLRRRQATALRGAGATPLTLIRPMLEHAAVGTPVHAGLGSAETIAAVSAADLAEAAEDLLPRATVYGMGEAQDTDRARVVSDSAPPWRGGLDLMTRPAADAQVGVRLALRDTPPAVLELMTEVLGNGPDARLHRAVRHCHHLAYGFTVQRWHRPGPVSIGATATVPAEHAADAVRVLTATVRRLADGVDRRETAVAHLRARSLLLGACDDPYAEVDAERGRVHGRPGPTDLLSWMADVPELPGLEFIPVRPAVAVVGPLGEEHRADVERAYEEVAGS
ncbi:insulinase family protein (plasmid) [Streptomyces sp. HUAS TT11]|uniref:insulinase family protein n=1 Tax=Streptomyces sp. HUAS TT11 TaxID=3447508 RepID=UPI003F65799D